MFTMKHLLLTTIAAVVLVGCGESQQSAPPPKAKPKPPTAKASRIPVLAYMLHFYPAAFKELLKPSKPSTAKVLGISIHNAARTGDIEAVKQHIAAGTDVNAKDWSKMTPLYYAVLIRRTEIAKLLIANGANVNTKDKKGFTSLDRAKNKTELADLLRKHGSKTGEELKAEGK